MYIDIKTPIQDIHQFLTELKFLEGDEEVKTVEKPGEGNMNVVLRVTTNKRSFIVKQSRPFVQKYQDIPAPLERIDVEYQFYSTITNKDSRPYFPETLGYFEKVNTLILEDLGDCDDMSFVYHTRAISKTQLHMLIDILADVHSANVNPSYPENKDLRLLNHQHMFVLPFQIDNGFSLDTIQEGLEALSIPYKKDEILKQKIAKVGEYYLSDEGNTLLHGDYYPGSWMTKGSSIYVIDPEFSFKGFAEFDLGVLAAHSVMATLSFDIILQIKEYYHLPINEELLSKIAGIEIMRRLIGLAQLPLERTLEEKEILMKFAYRLIV